ncbi:MAG: FAD:protein FMN transferase, partial [Ruminococcus sp.]|nr:FAD:protein FMN transferase [Ruminococcus sp.]
AVVSKDTAALLSDSLALCDRLDGCFDLTVYPAVQAWGFTTGDYRVPTDSELKALSDKIDYTAVTLSDDGRVSLPENVMLDLGAVAKGYAADVSRTILAANKAQAAVLNLGGTICLYGKKPDGSRFTVGIADPENPAGYFGYLSCDDTTVATSGGYERYFEHGGKRYIHILDPATAAPVDNGILSVTIVSDSGAFADAASTALFVMGLDKATQYCRSHPDFDCIILTDDKNLYLTEGVYDDFTLSDGYDFTLHKIS